MLIPFPFPNVPLNPPGPITGSEAGLGDEGGQARHFSLVPWELMEEADVKVSFESVNRKFTF